MTKATAVSPSIEGSIEIAATPREVWAVVSDLKRMGEWSPQCQKMLIFGDVRRGARALNINKQGKLVWPTTAKVVRYEPQKAIAFRITENRTVWTYELEPTADGKGTKVTERREAPQGVSKISGFATERLLGGTGDFEVGLHKGIEMTLARIKVEVEQGRA